MDWTAIVTALITSATAVATALIAHKWGKSRSAKGGVSVEDGEEGGGAAGLPKEGQRATRNQWPTLVQSILHVGLGVTLVFLIMAFVPLTFTATDLRPRMASLEAGLKASQADHSSALAAQQNALVPIGTIVPWPSEENTIPEGWVPCDGRPLDSSWSSSLKAVLGESLRLPDLRGLFIRGVSSTSIGVRDALWADEVPQRAVGSLQTDALKNHQHSVYQVHFGHPAPDTGSSGRIDGPKGTTNTGGVSSGSAAGAETRPKNFAVLWIIRVM